MEEGRTVDAETLAEEAERSGHGESYRLISTREGVRASVGARVSQKKPEFFIEVSVRLCGGNREANLLSLEEDLGLLKGLRARGYSMTCSDGSVVCERILPPEDLEAEESRFLYDPGSTG